MKIANIYGPLDKMHGATKWVMSFASELQAQGHQTEIYCPRFAIPKPYWLNSRIVSSNKKISSCSKIFRIGKNIWDTILLVKVIPKDTEVIVLHSEIPVLLAPLLRFRCKFTTIVYYCYQPPREVYDLWKTVKVDFTPTNRILLSIIIPFYKLIDKYSVSKCDFIMVWSDEYKKYAKEIYGRKIRIELLPAGINFRLFKDLDKSILCSLEKKYIDFDFKLLINSAITRKKNIPKFINLVSELNLNGYKVIGIVIGEGELLEEMKTSAAKLNILDKLDFVGFVSQEELPCYYVVADIIYYLENNGAWSLSIIEAGAAKKPVIAAHGGSMPTLIKHGNTGFILSADEENHELLQYSENLLKSKKARIELGNNGNCHTYEYSLENVVNKFMSYIKSQ